MTQASNPPPTQESTRGPGFLQGLLAGALLAGVASGALVLWWRLPQPAPIAVHPPPTVAPTVAPTPATITVYVSGAVLSPGLHTLNGDGRVADALAAAGGPAPDADPALLNLAQRLSDGARVHVARVGEEPPALPPAGSATRADSAASLGAPVNLNSATREELMALPGVGEKTADAIVAARPFASVEALDAVPGIGDVMMARLRPLVAAP